METQTHLHSFSRASAAVRKRVGQVRFARWLRMGHWVAGLVAVVAVLAARRTLVWREGEIWIVLGILVAWLAAGSFFSRFNRPGELDSLILLDRLGGWKDRFSSAWAFLKTNRATEVEELHISRASQLLSEATEKFRTQLALPSLRWIWILPTLAIVVSLLPIGRIPREAGEKTLTREMQDSAGLQADELKRESEQVKNLESLRPDEKEELEQLRVEVDEMADRLADADGLTAGEMLEALESRARAAEKLAEKMGMGSDEWASAEMLEEMASHPDTANLALAIKDKAASPAEIEALQMKGMLEHSEITRDTQERVTGALESIMSAAVEEDGARPVGERFGNASTKMLQSQPKTAAREFEELAKHFRLLASREEAKEKLEQLANSLRDAGSEISGSELEQMEKIAEQGREKRNSPEGLKGLNSDDLPEDLQKLLAPQMAQSGAKTEPSSQMRGDQAGAEGGEKSPVPGVAQNNPGQQKGEGKALQAPVPGENPNEGKSGQGMGLSDKAKEGSGEGGMLSAPVPGMEPGKSNQGAGMSLSGGTSNQTGQGGDQAGTGTAEMFENQTDALKSRKDSEVVAQINENGESTVRSVEGKARKEGATRTRQEIMTEFLSAEEQALDGKALPLSRREHVIRYFSAIRQQFEEADNAP